MLGNLWGRVRGIFSPRLREAEIREHLEMLLKQAPTPVFWMVGKTQSGKTSVIRYLTGAERAEIGKGFQPCTRFSSKYVFPSEQAPLLCFLDTRGLDEPGYDPAEDIARFDSEAHLVMVVVKALDHAQQNVLATLQRIRAAKPRRPVVLVLTSLHEAYPREQHPPYPFGPDAVAEFARIPVGSLGATTGILANFATGAEAAESGDQRRALGEPRRAMPGQMADLALSIAEQKRQFNGVVDRVVAVDLTPADEGFTEPNYGGTVLEAVLLDLLPAAQAQNLRMLALGAGLPTPPHQGLPDVYARRALPTILGYSTMAGTAGAIPIPFVDLALISAIQTHMLYELARLYGQPLTVRRLAEIASSLGLGLLTRQAGRELVKVIPGLGTVIGSVTGGALAAASTYALGQAFCFYYRAVLMGHAPDPADLKRYYKDELDKAEATWRQQRE